MHLVCFAKEGGTMATHHRRRVVAFNAGVWAFALGSAVALGYALNRPVHSRGAVGVTAPQPTDTFVVDEGPGVIVIPPVTIVGARPAPVESRPGGVEPGPDKGN
jgi:hypothetical protein